MQFPSNNHYNSFVYPTDQPSRYPIFIKDKNVRQLELGYKKCNKEHETRSKELVKVKIKKKG